jgi:hypothetical protein
LENLHHHHHLINPSSSFYIHISISSFLAGVFQEQEMSHLRKPMPFLQPLTSQHFARAVYICHQFTPSPQSLYPPQETVYKFSFRYFKFISALSFMFSSGLPHCSGDSC